MKLGIIGGSGLYQLPALTDVEWREVETPWGKPSDALLFGRLGATELVFLPRHGRGHRLLPHEINYRANIDALKRAGCTDILSLSACGSFREELAPGTFVLVDQFVDRTRGRASTFFGDGIAAHVAFAEPTCGRLADLVEAAAVELELKHRRGGAYVAIDGPRFSSRAESLLYRAGGLDVIGMTNMPEAVLAREAELCYLTVAMVTDYDAWHGEHDAVDVAQVLQVMDANAANARALVTALAARLPSERPDCDRGCDHVLDHAVITARANWPAETIEKLNAVAGRVLK